MNARRNLTVLVAAAVLGLAACGDDDEPADTGATETTAEQGDAPAQEVDLTKKPTVTVPKGDPPAGLQIEDLKVGDGPTAKSGDSATVQYVGVSYSTGEQFDASWDSGQPFTFTLGAGDVIPGWDQGVAGMKVGGRRQLIIPPELGYGEAGQPPVIAPNETLVFVIDLVEIG